MSSNTQAAEVAQLAEAVVEYSSEAIFGSTLEGIITSWNPAAERLYGYSSEEVVGRSAGVLTPEDRDGERDEILASIKAGRPVEVFETNRVRKDGTVFPVSLTVSPIRDVDGAIVGAAAIARDGTAERRAFEAAQRMAAIVEFSDDAIVGCTLDGIITSWNPAAERMSGYTSEEIIGRSVRFLTPEDRQGEIISVLARIRAGELVERFEASHLRKDGTVFPVSLTVSAIPGPGGAVAGASVIARDLTEQERSARYARSLIEAAMDPLVTISPEGKIDDVNQATVKVTGVPRDQLIGTRFSQYFTEPDRAHEGYQQVFAQGSVTDYPLTLRHRDGTLTDVLYNASVYRDAGGSVLGVLAAARDVTKQKEAFEAAQRVAAIVEYSDDAIVGSTLEGIITSWNPAAERLYGHSSNEIVGRSLNLLSPMDRAGEIIAVLARIEAGQPVDNFETFCLRKDRTTFPVKLTVAPIRDVDGAIVGVSSIARDVTAAKAALTSARRMAAIEFSGEAIISATLEGIITSWNPAAEGLFGYSGEEIIGESGTLLMPEDRAGELGDILARIRAGEHVQNFETIRARKDGTVFPASLTITPIYDADGTIVGASSTPRDITRQKEAFEAAQQVAAIVECSADAIVGSTLGGVITSWNPAAESLYGYSGQEIIGKPIELLSPAGRTGEITSILARIEAGQPVRHHETMRVRKGGTAIRVSLTVSPIRAADSAIVGASVIHHDLTEQD